MADQAITALPVKTASGIANTDYLLGIDSAEGYQMLIKDLGDYIIQNVQSSLMGSNQTLAAALTALNSKATDADKFTIVRYTNVSSTSTQTIVDLGVFTVYGSAIMFLRVDSAYDGASVYFVRRNASGYQIVKVYEGTHDQTPVVDSNGVLKLKAYTSGVTVHGAVITLAKWS